MTDESSGRNPSSVSDFSATQGTAVSTIPKRVPRVVLKPIVEPEAPLKRWAGEDVKLPSLSDIFLGQVAKQRYGELSAADKALFWRGRPKELTPAAAAARVAVNRRIGLCVLIAIGAGALLKPTPPAREIRPTVPLTVTLAQACSAVGGAIHGSITGRGEPPRAILLDPRHPSQAVFRNITTSVVDPDVQFSIMRACTFLDRETGHMQVVNPLNTGQVAVFRFTIRQRDDATVAVSGARQLPSLGSNISATYRIDELDTGREAPPPPPRSRPQVGRG